MPPKPSTPRERWIEAALELLVEGGPDAVRIEPLAAALGVTKGGFYGFFEGRDALLSALLDEWERRCTADVLDQIAAEGGDPATKIRRAGQLTSSDALLRLDIAVRIWARRDAAVAKRLRRIDKQRLDFLRKMFASFIDDPAEVEARSTLAFSLAIARHFMVAQHPGRTKQQAMQNAGEYLTRVSRGSSR